MTHRDDMRSDFLFARPSFLDGFARTADLGGSLNTYNQSRTPGEADARAIWHDWRAVGYDLVTALNRVRGETAK
jgi:hypothetical protein